MVKIDLITGFLGSGKTTFLKQYAQYLLRQGQNIGILENDFGAVNVDMMLLQDLEGEKCELEMISGGCDAETHRRRFRTKLIAMGMSGYDRVLVEPSGIYDVDEFFDVLRDEPLDQWYEIGSVIAIVDAGLDPELSDEANYLLASEAANAGSIVLSHADEVGTEQIEETIAHLNAALKQVKCSRQVGEEVLRKSGAQLTDADFEQILKNGYRRWIWRRAASSRCICWIKCWIETRFRISFGQFLRRRSAERFFESRALYRKTVSGTKSMEHGTRQKSMRSAQVRMWRSSLAKSWMRERFRVFSRKSKQINIGVILE